MATKSKKELDEVNTMLKEKLKEMKALEEKVSFTAEDLSQLGIGMVKDDAGKYSLVELKYDVEKNAAIIGKVTPLDTTDFAIASHKIKQVLVDRILRKARGDKYVE